MGRGVSAGGGQSSLGYLFGGGEAPTQAPDRAPTNEPPPPEKSAPEAAPDAASDAATLEEDKNTNKSPPAAAPSNFATNNYHRAEGQNCGNFLTDRPSTKVHAAPGGNSSLDYLFGDGSK